ncbi:hypothetical protein Q4603_11270 [Zobellia galactanivorans]|uniref:hypothetical protein n=1 Tax=Zobellia galactanivorans (strain DSM 12802 / CCUG 47099 / CIP 106680 / NCIMB 13871 / Dsij) TaxID=63186 RepID=UPI0026E3935F|nr:hypothetical protein [Zobellia galactanivorans]MDO6809197.1 hypothetical protein [Zobellia galactanivorans]
MQLVDKKLIVRTLRCKKNKISHNPNSIFKGLSAANRHFLFSISIYRFKLGPYLLAFCAKYVKLKKSGRSRFYFLPTQRSVIALFKDQEPVLYTLDGNRQQLIDAFA